MIDSIINIYFFLITIFSLVWKRNSDSVVDTIFNMQAVPYALHVF